MSAPDRVAVVVVHGIADQRAGQTVREIARLLCHGGTGEPRYAQGEIHEVLVPVAKLEPGAAPSPAATRASADAARQVETSRRWPGAPSGFYQAQTSASAPAAESSAHDLGLALNDYLLGRLELSDRDALYESRLGVGGLRVRRLWGRRHDDDDDRLLTRDAVAEAGLDGDVHFVQNGEELLDYLCRRGKYQQPSSAPRPGLILLDLNMPLKDGREALREIRADPELRRSWRCRLVATGCRYLLAGMFLLAGAGKVTALPAFVDRLEDALRRLERDEYDVVLLDLLLQDSQRLGTLMMIHEQAPKVPIVVFTGLADEVVGLWALSEGAEDYVVKGKVSGEKLAGTLFHAIQRHEPASRSGLKVRKRQPRKEYGQ